MNGDGAAEFVLSASDYFSDNPGQVGIFFAPTPGAYTFDDADLHLVSGSTTPDGFGVTVAPGDIDGDGLMDLAIGAPLDSRGGGGQAGSVTLVFGASL